VDNFIYEDANDTFIKDESMRERLLETNPNALRDMVTTFLEVRPPSLSPALPRSFPSFWVDTTLRMLSFLVQRFLCATHPERPPSLPLSLPPSLPPSRQTAEATGRPARRTWTSFVNSTRKWRIGSKAWLKVTSTLLLPRRSLFVLLGPFFSRHGPSPS
jgi:hypothetical protein